MTAEPPFLLFLWPHRLLVVGQELDAELHRHHAAQLCFSVGGRLRIRSTRADGWREESGFFVPPDTLHELSAGPGPWALILLEPESAEYLEFIRVSRPEPGIRPLAREARTATAVRDLVRQPEEPLAEIVARRMLRLPLSYPSDRAFDPRVHRALDWLRQNTRNQIRIAAVAKAAICSPSHIAHLFRDEVGVPLRRYVLWLRLRTAIEAALQGATLTDAAHAAGFADGAHFSRTFRGSFGLRPSFLGVARGRLRAVFCEPSKRSPSA